MKYNNFTDLGIVSTKKPFNTHLWWQHSTYGIFMVDSTNQAVLLHSTKARLLVSGSDWDVIDLSDNTNSFKIQSGWLDTNDLWLVMCDNDGIETEFEVCFIEFDDSNDCNPVDVQATSAGDSMLVYDIFKLGSDFYVYWNDNIGVGELDWITEVTVSPFVAKDSVNTEEGRTTHVVVVGTKAYWWKSIAPFTSARTGLYDSAIPAITFPFNVILTHFVKTDTNFKAQAYDGSDILYAVLEANADNKNYLITFSITSDAYTIGGEHNVILMLDRNSSTQEKAFHLTEYKIYQLQENAPHQLYLISIPPTDAVLIAITDNFLMNDDGDMFEYEDKIESLHSVVIDHQIEEGSIATVSLIKGAITIEKNLVMTFIANYTSATATAEGIIFEGMVTNFNEAIIQTVNLISLGRRELKRIKPSGDYTVDSDGLISALIAEYNNYVTVGTLTDGADLGTITLGGSESEETIIDGTANFEGWIWYMTPTGAIYFNNGTVDSGVNYSESDGIFSVIPPGFIHEEFNRIMVKGAYVAGVQMESAWQEDVDSQQRVGINEKEFTISYLDTVALCNFAAANLLVILAKDPKKITFTVEDTTKGLIQPGETITFEYALEGLSIASDQFLITSAIITKEDEITYTIIDELT